MTRLPGEAPVRPSATVTAAPSPTLPPAGPLAGPSDSARPSPGVGDLDFLFQDTSRAGRLGQDPDGRAVLEVAQVWEGTVLEVRHLAPGQPPLTLGGERATFAAPAADLPRGAGGAAGAARFCMFSHDEGGFRLRFSTRWEGFLQDADGARTPLSSAPEAGGARAASGDPAELREVVVPEGASAWLDTGHVIFAARHVPPGRRPPVPLADRVDGPLLGIAGVAATLAALLGAVILGAPPPQALEVVAVPDHIAQVVLQAPPPVPERIQPRPAATSRPEGERARGAEGRAGERDARQARARGSKAALDRRRQDRERVADAGIMGALNDEGVLAGVFGDSALSDELDRGIGGLIGARGVQLGSGGLSTRGDALGGGGRARGLGGLSPRGPGGGDGTYGEPDGGPKREGEVGRLPREVILLGALDKSLIDAVIKDHMGALRYCYQRELTQHPSLSGKVTVKFVIGADGSVSRARIKQSSLGSEAVEGCLTRRFLRMRFPEPQGGGVVIVSYPFFFSAG